MKKWMAILLVVALLTGVCSAAEETDNVTAALDALLIGAEYPQADETDPSLWSDSTVRDTIYRKLLWDDFLVSENSYLHKADLNPLPSENRYLHFNLEQIKKLTYSIFGRDFPEYVNLQNIFISEDELVIARETGEITLLRVQDFVERENTLVAVGTAVRDFGTHAEFIGCFEAVFEPSDSVYGYRLLSLKPIEETAYEDLTISASSKHRLFRPTYVIDGDVTTVWADTADGLSSGQWLQISAPEGKKLHVSAIGFAFASQEELTASKIRIEFDDGSVQEAEFFGTQDVILLEQTAVSQWVKFTVLEVFGDKNPAMAEICLHGVDVTDYFPERAVPEPTEPPTQETTQEPTEEPATTEEGTEEVTQAPISPESIDRMVNIRIWVILGTIVVSSIAGFVVLLVALKKKGSL